MRRKSKRRVISNNRIGATTLFLAIILAAVISIESTYLYANIMADRRVQINRALKSQVEVLLGDYDRELFSVYGIYGYCKGELDDTVFNKVLSSNGIDPEGYLTIGNFASISSSDIKKAVASYYSYRGASIVASGFTDVIVGALEEFEDDFVLSKLKSLTSGKAATLINEVLKGSERISEILSSVDNFTELDNAESKISDYIDLFSDYSSAKEHAPELGNSINLGGISNLFSVYEGIDDFASLGENAMSGALGHIPLCHYASYNFDSRMDNDSSINGTAFTDIHYDNYMDSEYILTGLSGFASKAIVNSNIFLICLLSEILQIRFDSKTMAVINGIAVVLEIVISILTLGVGLAVPFAAYKALVVLIYGIVLAINDVNAVLDGKSVELFAIDGVPFLEDGILCFEYSDFIFTMMLFQSDENIFSRISEVLERDFGTIVINVELAYVTNNDLYSYEGGYYLYEQS